MDFGERLKQLRKDAGLTQDSIAEKLGVHNQTVSKWERGLLQPDISLLGNLADALGVSMEKLLDCKEGEQTFKGTFSTTQLGQSIAKNRIIKNESQQALATALGVSADTVSHWERGQTMPSAITLCAIAEHFDVPVSELYYGAKDDEPSPVVINVKKRRPIIALIAGLAACLVISVIFAVLGIAGVFGKKDVMFTITVNGETISVKENTFYSPETPERAGYDFAGWRDKGGNEIDFPMKIDDNLEIESFFTPHEYTIDYWLNGGAIANETLFFTIETDEIALPVPEKVGAKFIGWYLSPSFDGEPITAFVCEPHDVTFYAKWDKTIFTVKYELCGGTLQDGNPTEVDAKHEFTLNTPTRAGYTFVGWSDSPSGGETYTTVGGKNAKNAVLYAVWQKSDKKFDVTYDYDGGTPVKENPTTIRVGETITLSPAVKLGYDFIGWSDDKNGNGNLYDKLSDVKANLSLYAVYRAKQFTIIYEFDGYYDGESNPNIIFYDEAVTLSPVNLHGRIFGGWYTAKTGGKKIEIIDKSNLTELSVLYARYTLIEYKITLDADGGTLTSGESEYTVTVNSPGFYLPTCTKNGFEFLGWFDGDGKKYERITASDVANITLTAKWRESDKTYSIDYVLGDETATHSNPTEFKCSETLFLSAASRHGYDFIGWSLTPNGETIEIIAAGNEENLVLYAIWQIIKEYGSQKDFTYEKTFAGVTITAYTGETGKNVNLVVPSIIDGMDVVAVNSLFSTTVFLKSLTLPESAGYLGQLMDNGTLHVTTPLTIPAAVKELGEQCLNEFSGRIYFAENSRLEKIGDYALNGSLYNTLILPDSVTTLGIYIARDIDVVLPKSLNLLNGNTVSECNNIFFPEGISKSLQYIATLEQDYSTSAYYCAATEKAALDKLLAASNSKITLKSISKRELTLDYGTRTEKVNDYYAILPDINDNNNALLGWFSEFNGDEKVFFPERMFISDTLTTVKAKTVKRSAHDGLTAETAAKIDPTEKNYEMFASWYDGKIYKFFFTLKTDKPILIKVSFVPIYTTTEFDVLYKNKHLPTYSFEYKPGEIILLYATDQGAAKVTMNIEIIDL